MLTNHDEVRHGHGEVLYTQVATTMSMEVERLARSLDHAAPDGVFLEDLQSKCKRYTGAVSMITDVVQYMDMMT